MPTPPVAVTAVSFVKSNHLWIGVEFQPIGLILDYTLFKKENFETKLANIPQAAPPMNSLPAHRAWEISVPLFKPRDHVTVVAPDRVTQMVFYSDHPNWKFVNGGFETKNPAHMQRFQGTTIINGGAAVQTTFLPDNKEGETFPYNLYMETVVWVDAKRNGHAVIIIDPVVETGTVRQVAK